MPRASRTLLFATFAILVAGSMSLLDVIDTERQLLETQDAVADVNAQRSQSMVALHRAYGG